ncbi:MAG: Uncharacterized protein K0R94_456 [Burkholderiales bacterium]|jgi:hypothetical protein|nr:Uncharacterized protein [Burkholderiales bacterium]
MQKFLFLILSGLIVNSFAIDFTGKYLCSGYDTKDGAYTGDVLTLKLDAGHSYEKRDLYSYSFILSDAATGKIVYNGSAVSVGSNLSIHFKNTDPKKSTDEGVGLAVASKITRDKNGNFMPSKIQKFYYEKDYTSDGSEECTQIKEK